MTMSRAVAVAIGLTLYGCLLLAAPAMASAGTIEGTVTDDSPSPSAVPAVEVCAHRVPFTVEDRCGTTNGSGYYAIFGVGPGDYTITFRPSQTQNFVVQFYDDAQEYSDADLVTVADGAIVSGVGAEMHEGGTITGVVTDAGTGEPIQGLPVCADSSVGGRCTVSGPGGLYTITGLPADPGYRVEFGAHESFYDNGLNYLRQHYNGKEEPNSWDLVGVTVGDITAGIDAAMKPGAQILGRVLEVGTIAPLPKIEVCALDPGGTLSAQEFEQCTFTDATGHYAIRGLRSGTFIVVFSRERFLGGDGFFPQWYDGATSAAGATPITISPPQTRTGVDARLLSTLDPQQRSPRVIVTLVESPPAQSKPIKCKKGFRRKKVKGRVRCVKLHKKRRHHRRGQRSGGQVKR